MTTPATPRSARWLPVEPLAARIRRRGGIGTERAFGATGRALHRGLADGRLSVRSADRLAVVLLGEHPAMVWGEAWWSL